MRSNKFFFSFAPKKLKKLKENWSTNWVWRQTGASAFRLSHWTIEKKVAFSWLMAEAVYFRSEEKFMMFRTRFSPRILLRRRSLAFSDLSRREFYGCRYISSHYFYKCWNVTAFFAFMLSTYVGFYIFFLVPSIFHYFVLCFSLLPAQSIMLCFFCASMNFKYY